MTSLTGVTVTYTEVIPTSKQMAEFYVWQEGYESYATIRYEDRVVEVERGGEMHLTLPYFINGELCDEGATHVRYSDDLEAAGINDDDATHGGAANLRLCRRRNDGRNCNRQCHVQRPQGPAGQEPCHGQEAAASFHVIQVLHVRTLQVLNQLTVCSTDDDLIHAAIRCSQ
jgi:hypothetical protein